MSNQFFPTLDTSSWKMSRTPQHKTTVKNDVSGDTKRAPLQTSPRWKWTLKNGVLQTATGDLQAIQNLYTAMYGRLDYFLWKDPEGDSIVDPTVQINVLGNFYWPVAFTEDAMEFDRFAYQLWECGTCEFEQVLIPEPGFTQSQQPNGAVSSSSSLSITTTHILGTGYSAQAWAKVGPVSLTLGGEPLGGAIFLDSTAWTSRTDTFAATTANPYSTELVFGLAGTLLGSTTPPDQLLIYDVTLTVTYEDGTVGTLRPSLAIVTSDGSGTVDNSANAVDGDSGTAAKISKTTFGPFNGTPLLTLTHFV